MNGTITEAGKPIVLRGWVCPCGAFNGEEKERIEVCRVCAFRRDAVDCAPTYDDLAQAARAVVLSLTGECECCKLGVTWYVWPSEDDVIRTECMLTRCMTERIATLRAEGVDTGPWGYCDEHLPTQIRAGYTATEADTSKVVRVINRTVRK